MQRMKLFDSFYDRLILSASIVEDVIGWYEERTGPRGPTTPGMWMAMTNFDSMVFLLVG